MQVTDETARKTLNHNYKDESPAPNTRSIGIGWIRVSMQGVKIIK